MEIVKIEAVETKGATVEAALGTLTAEITIGVEGVAETTVGALTVVDTTGTMIDKTGIGPIGEKALTDVVEEAESESES